MEVEDDLFLADLSRQIALLVMDDDEDLPVQGPPSRIPLPDLLAYQLSYLHKQVLHHIPQAMMPPPFAYEAACRRESKGTGVFIPRCSYPRRKSKSVGHKTSNNNSLYRQIEKSGTLTQQHAAPNNGFFTYNYSNSNGLSRHQ